MDAMAAVPEWWSGHLAVIRRGLGCYAPGQELVGLYVKRNGSRHLFFCGRNKCRSGRDRLGRRVLKPLGFGSPKIQTTAQCETVYRLEGDPTGA